MAAKKPLFNRPAWAASGKKPASTLAATSNTAAEEDEILFGRQRIYEDLIALERKEKEEKERRAKEKEREKAERKAAAARDRLRGTPSPPPKKRRVSADSDAEDGAADKADGGAKSDAVVISLEDDNDNDSKSGLRQKQADDETDLLGSDNDDPYLQELNVKARENQRLQRLGLAEADRPREEGVAPNRPFSSGSGSGSATATLPQPEEQKADGNDAPSVVDSAPTSAKSTPPPPLQRPIPPPGVGTPASLTATVPGSEYDNTEVLIYINPLIPNTKPLIVERKASQTLEFVKSYWCKKQNLSEAETARVFFVWRDMKLYNSSTMRHILKRLDKERKPGQKESEGKIVLEAVTQEIYDSKRAELAQKKERTAVAAGLFSSLSGSNTERVQDAAAAAVAALSADAAPTTGPPAMTASNDNSNSNGNGNSSKFIIKLVSKGYGELPIRIRPESTVGKIATAYMHQVVLPQDSGEDTRTTTTNINKVPYLIFDGDRLENGRTAQEVGLEEGDVVEVQFR